MRFLIGPYGITLSALREPPVFKALRIGNFDIYLKTILI